MTAGLLRRCPTCTQALTPQIREVMGLRNGELLNSLCPGKIGPSDIDNVIHVFNGNRVAFFEYKDHGAQLSGGQKYLLNALQGEWVEEGTGRFLNVRYWVIPNHPDDGHEALREAIAWLWPELEVATT